MKENQIVKLSDVCDLIPGFAFKSSEFGEHHTKAVKIGDIQPPYVNYEGMAGVDISKYSISKLAKYEISKGDFVLAMTGATIGKIGRYISETGAYINQRVLKFKPHDDVNADFIYYVVSSATFQKYILNNIDSETAQPNISAGSVGKYEFTLPSIEEQNRIADVLVSIDNKIQINRQINDNLEQQAQALYKSWFVDFEPFCEEEFIESSLGSIPAGWKVGQLSDVCEIIGGGTPSKSHPEYYCNKGIAWLTPKDLSVSKSKFSGRGSEDITPEGYKQSSAKLMPRGTVLFSSRAPIGYISIATNEICTNQGFKSAVPGIAGTGYLYYFLKANTDTIESKASGSTFKEASGTLMKSLEVIIPADGILNQFEAELAPILKKQENIASEIQTLTTLRDALLPKLMSGELKINEIDC